MKKYLFSAALVLAAACAKQAPEIVAPSTEGVSFVCSIDNSKVTTAAGKSSFDAGDQISVFSTDNAGTIVSNNVSYSTVAGGATASFINADTVSFTAAEKYYAFFPASKVYANNTTAHTGTGFPGATAGDPVTDYRYMPVAVNSSASIVIDPATGKTASSNVTSFFYATGTAPALESDPVSLQFKPILPLLEFSIYGIGTVKSIKVELTDKTEGSKEANTWMSAKGIFDMSTGTLTTTNFSSTAYSYITITLSDGTNDYVTLDETTPVNFKFTTGRINVTKGLTLTFTDKDGNTLVKKIWGDKTVNTYAAGVCKHIHQPLDVYFSGFTTNVDMSKVDWTKSYIHYIKGLGGVTVGAITKEFLGVTVNKQAIVAYPVKAGKVDYTDGTVLEVTLDAGAAPSGNIHGGSVNAYTINKDTVAYTAGTSAPITAFYVKDGVISTEKPSGKDCDATIVPYILTSASAINHKLVKIGNKVWTAEGYKSTKKYNGDDYTVYYTTDATESKYGYLFIKEDTNAYLFGAGCVAFKNSTPTSYSRSLAPTGWNLPTVNEWKVDLGGFLGGAAGSYTNMSRALLFDRTCFKYSKIDTQWVASDLGYYNTWSCEAVPSKKAAYMLMCKNGNSPTTSEQGLTNNFEVRLLKTLE